VVLPIQPVGENAPFYKVASGVGVKPVFNSEGSFVLPTCSRSASGLSTDVGEMFCTLEGLEIVSPSLGGSDDSDSMPSTPSVMVAMTPSPFPSSSKSFKLLFEAAAMSADDAMSSTAAFEDDKEASTLANSEVFAVPLMPVSMPVFATFSQLLHSTDGHADDDHAEDNHAEVATSSTDACRVRTGFTVRNTFIDLPSLSPAPLVGARTRANSSPSRLRSKVFSPQSSLAHDELGFTQLLHAETCGTGCRAAV